MPLAAGVPAEREHVPVWLHLGSRMQKNYLFGVGPLHHAQQLQHHQVAMLSCQNQVALLSCQNLGT